MHDNNYGSKGRIFLVWDTSIWTVQFIQAST